MVEFRYILCPIDFSDTSIRTLTYAAALARWYEAQLEVLHVVPAFAETVPSQERGSSSDPDVPATPADIIAATRRALQKAGALASILRRSSRTRGARTN